MVRRDRKMPPMPQGIGDGLTEAVLFGHLKVDDGTGVVEADLDGVHHEVCAAQGILAVGNAQILGDLGAALVDVLIEEVDHDIGLLQAIGVDVVEGEFKVAEGIGAHGVADDVLGKYGAACTHECDLSHDVTHHPLAGGLS